MAEVALSGWYPDLRLTVRGVDDPVMLRALRRAAITFCEKSEYVRYDYPAIKIAPFITKYQLGDPGSSNMQIHSLLEVRHSEVERPLALKSEEEMDQHEGHWRTDINNLPRWAVRSEDGSDWYIQPVPHTEFINESGTITAATAANPVVLTAPTHGRATGDRLYLNDVVGMTQLNGTSAVITVSDENTVSLDDVDGTQYSAYISGGTWKYNDDSLSLVRVSTKPTRSATVVDQQVYDHYYEVILAGAASFLLNTKAEMTREDILRAREMDTKFDKGWRAARVERKRGSADRDGNWRGRPRKTLYRTAPLASSLSTTVFDTEDY